MPEKTLQLAFTLAGVVILSANRAYEEFIIPWQIFLLCHRLYLNDWSIRNSANLTKFFMFKLF